MSIAGVVFSTVQSCMSNSDSINKQYFMMNSRIQLKFDVVNEVNALNPTEGWLDKRDCGWHRMSGYILFTLRPFQAADEVTALKARAGTPCPGS